MYYIRFLKKPNIKGTKNKNGEYIVEAKIAITTDLQDSLLQHFLAVEVVLEAPSGSQIRKSYEWRETSREIAISFIFQQRQMSKDWSPPFRLGITPVDISHDQHNLEDLAQHMFEKNRRCVWGVQPVWSSDIWPGQAVDSMVQRRLILPDKSLTTIWEDAGNSLTAHIWDAGLVLSAVLCGLRQHFQRHPKDVQSFLPLHDVLLRPKIDVLELGTGCGVVGIVMAQCFPHAQVQVTDLPSAEELATYNVDKARFKGGNIEYHNLDWSENIPPSIKMEGLDLVLVSDCTYNTVSIPDLVKTLVKIMQKNEDALILVATKRRHDSEELFLDLMKKTDLSPIPKISLSLPREVEADQTIELYMFKHGSKGQT